MAAGSLRATAGVMALGLAWGATACGGDSGPEGTETSSTASSSSGAGQGGAGQGGAGQGGSGLGGAGGDCFGAGGGLGEGGAPTCNGSSARFVTHVVSACLGPDQSFGQDKLPAIVEGPPRGGGCCSGSLDVVSLGNGGSITVAFEGNSILDGPGPDFLVFENAFYPGGDTTKPYAELATVEVSADGVTWSAFPCTAVAYPYGTCAGWHPVFASPESGDIDPLDPDAAGGDPFDLAEVGLAEARFVRITDRPDLPSVFDLDAVGIVNAACP